MNRMSGIALGVLMGLGVAGFSGCKKEDVKTAEQKTENAADKAGSAISTEAGKVKDAAKDLADKAKPGLEKAAEQVKEVAKEGVEKGKELGGTIADKSKDLMKSSTTKKID